MNFHFFKDLEESASLLLETYLLNPKPCSLFNACLAHGSNVQVSEGAMCKIGEVKAGAYVWMWSDRGMVILNKVDAFVHVRLPSESAGSCFVISSPLVCRGNGHWLQADSYTIVSPVQSILRKAVVRIDPDAPYSIYARA